jgi:hypothetical protein
MVTSFDCSRDSFQRVAEVSETACDPLEACARPGIRKVRCLVFEKQGGLADKLAGAKDFAVATCRFVESRSAASQFRYRVGVRG